MKLPVQAGLLGLLVATSAPAESLRLVYEDGRAPVALVLERLEAGSMEWYVGANGLARALDLERFWKPETGKLVLKVGEKRLQVTVDTRLVLVDEDEMLLHLPVRYRAGSVMVPLEFLDSVLVPAAGGSWRFERDSLTFSVGRLVADVLGLEFDTASGDTEVRLRLARGFQHRVQATSHELVRVRIFDAVVDPMALTLDTPAPLLRSVRAEQRGREALVYLELDAEVDGFDASTRDQGRTLVVTLRRRAAPMPEPEFKLPESAGAGARTRRATCSVLVLDAGHGGSDPGVQASGLLEKDVTLTLATQLEPRLEKALHMQVELLRNGDRGLTDDRRAELANRSGGDILISLHCNGWFDSAASGFEVHFVGSRAAPAAAGKEAADFRPWRNAQVPYVAHSQKLAQLLQVELGKKVGLANRGARESDLDFLRGVAMPAVLLEVGFLTNPSEADALEAPEYMENLAAAITSAVQRFCAQLETENPERLGFVVPERMEGTDDDRDARP